MEKHAVIVAGGAGQRMQSSLPKQFILLRDQPILMHTIGRFVQAVEGIHLVVVLPEAELGFWDQLCRQLDFDIEHTVVAGGETRFQSVKNGLARCPDKGVVAIHDGVRPLVSPDLIQTCLAEAETHGSALPVVSITQSLRKREGDRSTAVDRAGMLSVQTPQCFDLALLQPAFNANDDPGFTDDATVFENAGYRIHLVEGEETNLKITTPADLRIAEALMDLMQ